MLRKVAVFLAIWLVFSCRPSFSQSQQPPSPYEGAPFSLSAAAIRTASAANLPDKLSDATILYVEADYRFAQNGALTYTNRMVYRVETQKAVQDYAEIALEWDPWYQNPAELHARVLQPDGSFAELDQKTITDGPINSSDEGTYTSARLRKAPLPGLSVGAIVEQVVSVEDKTPYFDSGLAFRYYFTGNAPVEREKVVIDVPSSLPFHDRLLNAPSLSSSRSEAEGIRHIVYAADHEPARIDGDIDLDSASSSTIPVLEFATGSSWAAVAQGYAGLVESRIVTDQVRPILPSMPSGSRLERIQQLVQALHRNVRYTGIEFDESEIVPQTPEEVLKRHYGDCKDKAAFLVAMLRAEGIPANMALLSAAVGRDVDPEMPGMNLFNHAIVYVPAAGSDPALWIDATAEFNQVGTLPYQDAGRLALVIAPGTTELLATPSAQPEDSVLVETRTFHLADFGPSQAVEDSQTHGYVDAEYRSLYGSATTTKVHDDLETYARGDYLTDKLAIDHGDGADLSKPFHLTLTMDGARRGYTSLADSEVVIFPSGVLNNLPPWLRTQPTPLPEDASPELKQARALAEQHRSEVYQISPFIYEQHYEITPPAGFAIRGLPPDHTTQLGPATLTERYSQDPGGAVKAVLRFTTGKSRITAAEAVAMRDGVVEILKRPIIEIVFLEKGQQLLQAGRTKEAIAADQAAAAASPRSALPHARFARLLVDAGVGDMARTEAARAVQIDPSSAPALMTQGWVLEHDQMGRLFGVGFDRADAIAAFKSALALHSDDLDPRFDLAVLYEYGPDAVRYSSRADLPAAIDLYHSLIDTAQKDGSSDLKQEQINLAFALFYAKRFSELDKLLPDVTPGPAHSALAIASAAAQKDAAAGTTVSDQLNLTAADRSNALVATGKLLAEIGLYPQAAEILSQGIAGQSNAPDLARRIEIYRSLKRAPAEAPPVTSPQSLAYKAMFTQMGTPDRKTVAAMLSPHAFRDAASLEREVTDYINHSGHNSDPYLNPDPSPSVWNDMVVGTATFQVKGDDTKGYSVTVEFLDRRKYFYIVKEEGAFHIVSSSDHAAATYILYALDHGQNGLAKSMLDWERDGMSRGSADDPLSGPLLPRFWTIGSARPGADSPESMRVAAIALMVGSMDIKPLLDSLVPLRDKASGAHQEDFDLLLARGYTGAEQPVAALPYIANLLQEEPDSAEAVRSGWRCLRTQWEPERVEAVA